VGGNGGGDFDNLPFGVACTKYFWAYYCQLNKQKVPLPSMACFKTFLLWMHYKLHVHFSHIRITSWVENILCMSMHSLDG